MKYFDISLLLVIPQKVMPDVYVLCAAVFNRIIRHADSTRSEEYLRDVPILRKVPGVMEL